MQKYVFLDYRPPITWLYPIWNALNRTTSKVLHDAWSKRDARLSDLGIAVVTKLVILRVVVGRFNTNYERLLKLAAEDAEEIRVDRQRGTVWIVHDEMIAYELLADVEAFIFESRSLYEILGKFLVTFYDVIFSLRLTEEDLKTILRNAGLDVAWTTLLRDERKSFFHDTAPWLALSFADDINGRELLIVRENVKTLDDPQTFARLGDYNAIYDGLAQALDKLQQHILKEIEGHEALG